MDCGKVAVPADIALSIRQFLAKNSVTVYGKRFQMVEDVVTNVLNDLKDIPQTSFKQSFQKWKRWWDRCIAAQGDYFEGDNIQ
jgi:hypothetical protein